MLTYPSTVDTFKMQVKGFVLISYIIFYFYTTYKYISKSLIAMKLVKTSKSRSFPKQKDNLLVGWCSLVLNQRILIGRAPFQRKEIIYKLTQP